MCPPTASTPIDVDFASTDENLFGSLERMIRGSPLPCNVINDVNPYNHMPSNLPDGVWYLVCSKENTSAQHGQWRAKGETCEIFSNSYIIGWRTTLEFFEGQVPNERKTDWVMQEFRITQKRLYGDKKEEDSSSLCRVFLSGKQSPNHEMQQKLFSANINNETHSHSTELSFDKDKDDTRQVSIIRREVSNDGESRTSAVMERPTNHAEDNLPEADNFSEDDFLELHDLDQPLSPSSSSDNSSGMTLSSDEYFDHLALLQELEPCKNKGVGPENAEYKYSFSTSHTPNEVVIFPGSLINVEGSKPETGDIFKTESDSAMVNRTLDSRVLKQAVQGQKANYRGESPSSNSHGQTSSFNGQIALQNGEKKAAVGRMKKLKRKYFCFMPF
ncbi:NAC domain-containing protein [Citrus sinensis]|uniref:NAC transcription factor 29-like isoform X2 n=1 Tax=Citrus sinensis TaxID=2711 RepID=UPI00219E447A|nr:NAC transcription factor 29-like isoform X2 [Citrus sinensis]KAH9692833.1 NAC domain-containing protein [Citrus sinensis]